MNPLAIVSAVETCYSLGTKAIEICKTWQNADTEVRQRVVIVESIWNRTRIQAEFMERVAPAMDDRLRRIKDDLLGELVVCLTKAISTLEAVTRKELPARPSVLSLGPRAKKASWVWKKNAIDDIIKELEAWQRHYDPSWFLSIMRAEPIIMDRELAKARASEAQTSELPTAAKQPLAVAERLRNVQSPKIEQTKKVFMSDTPIEWRTIPFSSVKAGRLVRMDMKWYIVDTVEVKATAQVRNIMQDVSDLAVKLSAADPLAFGLLNCKRVIAVPRQAPHPQSSLRPVHSKEKDFSCFRFVLQIPQGMEVLQSLRQLLLNSDEHISLSRKMRIACELARAVNYVHTFAFVHKNVRPESVLCFEEDQGASNPNPAGRTHAFLVGFDTFRTAAAETIMAGDMYWDRNIYRHPLRQGNNPAEKYYMQHDIYSLGVCLLEIGLWQSFVEYTTEDEVVGPPRAKLGRTHAEFQKWHQENSVRTTRTGQGASSNRFLDTVAFRLKDYLVEKARIALAPRMGEKYAHVVLSCLTCLDEGNDDFDVVAAARAGDDTTAALWFIENIMKGLDDISV